MRKRSSNEMVDFGAEEAAGCVCFNFRKAARAVTQLYDAMLEPCGLRATQVSLLIAVHFVGPVTISWLARELVMDRTTLTRNLKPLDKLGLIKIVPGKDRRTREVTLTQRGRKTLVKALPLWRKAQTRAIDAVGTTRWKRLLSDFRPVVALAQAE